MGFEPCRVTYEELCADPTATTLAVLRFLGLEPQPGSPIAPPPWLTRQADELNARWAERYRELAAG
jgi:LPS sulfotransferase NodH